MNYLIILIRVIKCYLENQYLVINRKKMKEIKIKQFTSSAF